MLENYLSHAGITRLDTEGLLFRAIVSRKIERLRESGGLSYTRMREFLREKLEQLGFSADEYSLHSLRSGGATTAAVAGIPDRAFKRHGRWKSDKAKEGLLREAVNCFTEPGAVILYPYCYLLLGICVCVCV